MRAGRDQHLLVFARRLRHSQLPPPSLSSVRPPLQLHTHSHSRPMLLLLLATQQTTLHLCLCRHARSCCIAAVMTAR
jgi:hypothetical protein